MSVLFVPVIRCGTTRLANATGSIGSLASEEAEFVANGTQLKPSVTNVGRESALSLVRKADDELAGRKERYLTAATVTLDHLYSRLNPRRREPNRAGEKRRLLACRDCNQRRSKTALTAANAEKKRRRILSALGIQNTFE